jgi:hypothetical protein
MLPCETLLLIQLSTVPRQPLLVLTNTLLLLLL